MAHPINLMPIHVLLMEVAAILGKIPEGSQLRDPHLHQRVKHAIDDLGGDRGPLAIIFTPSELEKLSNSFSDLLCWHAGFAAARDNTYPLGVHELREFNIKVKRALED